MMINASNNTALEVGDFVFLQFGNILTSRGGKIDGEWAILNGNG